MLADKERSTNIGVGIGLVLQIAGAISGGLVGLGVILLGLIVFAWGCCNYMQGKGYAGAIGLLGLLGVIGLAALVILPDKHKRPTTTPIPHGPTGAMPKPSGPLPTRLGESGRWEVEVPGEMRPEGPEWVACDTEEHAAVIAIVPSLWFEAIESSKVSDDLADQLHETAEALEQAELHYAARKSQMLGDRVERTA